MAAITNNATGNTYTRNFIPAQFLPVGTGEIGRYKDEVVGILLGIEPREGTYTVKDRKTGAIITRPNSWTAVMEDGSMWSWPTYIDEADGKTIRLWSRFDPSINIAECIQNRRVIHLWKDEQNFCHLELMDTTTVMNPTPITQPAPAPQVQQPQPQPQPAPQTQGFVMPWA